MEMMSKTDRQIFNILSSISLKNGIEPTTKNIRIIIAMTNGKNTNFFIVIF